MKTPLKLKTPLLLTLLLATTANPTFADDPFLEPQVLPPEIRQLTLNDSKTGEDFIIRLDENHLPLAGDFHGNQSNIPFVIEGALLDSESGSRLHSWTLVPKENANGIRVLLFHGNGGNVLSDLGAGVGLLRQGFRVTLVDYSGYGWSTGEATRDNLLLDGEAALTKFSADARVADEKRVLYGMSLGGHLAVVVAERNPDAIDGLVIEGAFSSHRDMAAHRKGGLVRAMVSEPYSAEKVIGDFIKPLLVIHSVDDAVVPFSMGEALFEAANEPKEFLEIDQAHLAGIPVYGERIGKAIVDLVSD